MWGRTVTVYAIIDAGVVHNIGTGDSAWATTISSYHEYVIDLTGVTPQPGPGWSYDSVAQTFTAPTVPINTIILNALTTYQEAAPAVLRQIYATNTLAGITTAQSDAAFDLLEDVILRVMQGAFPTAIYRLMSKTPSGFVTQPMIDNFIAILQSFL